MVGGQPTICRKDKLQREVEPVEKLVHVDLMQAAENRFPFGGILAIADEFPVIAVYIAKYLQEKEK
jgi:hypothetical protein